MPANPRQLYNKLKEEGHISITYAEFRLGWDEPGWSVDFHKALQAKQLTKMNYDDFIYTFSDKDPNWNAEEGIEISDEEIAEGEFLEKQQAEEVPENLAANFTGLPMENGELVSPEGNVYITKTDEEVAQELETKLQKEKVRSFQKTEALNALYGNDLDARIAETASIKIGKGFEDYVADLEEGIPEQEEDKTADALNKVMGSMGNIPIQMEAAWEGTKALIVAGVNESDGGGGLADVMTGDASFFDTYELMDPVTEELVSFSSDRKRYQELQRLNRGADKPIQVYRNGKPVQLGKLADQFVGNKLKEIKKLNEGTFETGSITQGYKEGDGLEMATGVFNAVSSLAATMIPAAMTGGTSLAPQVITPMWVDYNTTKAMTKYADSDDPIAAMIAADDTEFAVPLSLGAGALAFEAVGFKGISKYIAGGSKLGGSFMGIAKNQLGWMLTANKEGGTEWIQGGLETMNTSLAEGKSMDASVKLAAKNMFSQDGLEQYLQGAFGSGVSTAPSAAKRYVQRALRSDPKGHKAIVEGINDIAKLKEARMRAVKAKNKVEVKLLDADIKAVENRIKSVVQENNTIFDHLTDAENKQLRGIAKEMDAIAADAAEVDAAVTRGDITKMEGYQTKRKLQARHNKLSNDIADLKANVDLSQLRSDVSLARKLSKNLPNLKINSFDNQTQVRKAIEGARNEKGELYTSEELDTFAKESAGLFWEVDGIEYIVINESLSKKAGLTTTGQHEFLHKVLNRVLKADPKLALKMGGAVKETIKKLSEAGLIGGKKNPVTGRSYLAERMDAYADKSKSMQAEELITVLSEAIEKGEIKITEESKGFFGGVKELIRRSMLDMGVTNVNLEGDGVMQFIKDYNREFQRGKLSRATKRLMKGGKKNLAQRTGAAIKNVLNPGGMKQSLDSNEASFTWEEDTTGSFTTTPEQVGENTIALSIEKGGNKQLIQNNPELGLDPNKPVYTIAFEDQNTEFDMTNSGEGLMVFGTVINNMKAKLDEIGAEQVIYHAVPEGNRQRLYTLMGATMAKKMGLNFEAKVLTERASYIPKGDKVFVLTKPGSGIKQSLDASAKLKWTKKNEEFMGDYLTSSNFTVGDQKFNMLITEDIDAGSNLRGIKKGGELTFNNITDGTPRRSLLSKLPNSIKVFGIVVNATKEVIKREGYDAITFTADRDGRTSTYTAIANRVADDMGWRVDVDRAYTENMYKYTISAPKGRGMKQSKLNEKDLYQRTNDLYNEYKDDLHTGGFLIGMEWENQIKKLAGKYRNLPGYDVNIEDVIAEVMTANQGIPGLVNSYKKGKLTKDGKNEVSLEGYINKYLPNYINTALGKFGIGLAKDEGGFTADVTEINNVTSENTAEDTINLEGRESTEAKAEGRGPQLKEAIKLDESPELKADIENKVVKNISAAISLFGKAKTRNEKIDGFIKATRQGVKNDEKGGGAMLSYIEDLGIDNFLRDTKAAFIENSQRNDLQRSPLFKRVVQQKFKGVWKSREKITINGKVQYEYLMDDGKPYPARHPDMDRDKMAETGTTAGHYKYRKAPNAASLISDGEFIETYYKDGAGRSKPNKVKLKALASQYSAEIGIELFAEQLNNREGAIFDELTRKVQLTSEMTPAEIKVANEQKLIIREGMAAVLTDKGIAETLKDLERGGIKQSKVNKTGFSWFDGPRIDMTNYLAGLENNDIRTDVVSGKITSPKYTELYEEMKEAYAMYTDMQVNEDGWADSLKNYSRAFKDKDFANFDAFVDNTLGQVNNSVNGILGVKAEDSSLGKRNEGNKDIARKQGVEAYINDTLNKLPVKERGAALADLINTLVGATSTNLYQNTPGFYKNVVQPMINAHGIKATDFTLVETEGGNTIHYKGKKITTDFARGVMAEDTGFVFEQLAEGIPMITNTVDVAARIAEAKVAKKQYINYLKWMRKNHKRMSPNTLAIMLKAFGGSGRSVAQTMIPITKSMLVKQANEMDSYTTISSVPASYINLASLNYVLTGKGLDSLNKIIQNANKVVVPKQYAKVVDQFHHNTPINDFSSKKVNAKLQELDLPAFDLTDLGNSEAISVMDLEGRAQTIKFNKTWKAVGTGLKFSKPAKGISVWDFDDTLAKTKSNVLYTMPGQTRIFHGGAIKSVRDINGFAYFSEDQGQADAYAKGNEGEVNSFMLEEASIATEDQVFAVINQLGITPQNGWQVDESHLYELIDPRFEQSFNKKDREKLAVALKKQGIKAARFTDINIAEGDKGGRETVNIVVFNKTAVKTQNKLTAAEFAAESERMEAEGVTFDFSEFSKVVQGAKGPLFDTAVKRNEKFGNEHVYILTARPANSARAIHEFLKGIGLDVRLENITGLQDSNPQAKADWVKGKASEGYNDFYFADDHIGNVAAVKDILNSLDVKSDVQQAGMKQSAILSDEFNNMLERTNEIDGLALKSIKKADARQAGKKVDRSFSALTKIFIPPSAEDFMGLMYRFAGKGKQGDADLKMIHDTFVSPYIEGVERLDQMNTAISLEYKKLTEEHPGVTKMLHQIVPGTNYTYDMAIRYYLYERSGFGDMMKGEISGKNAMLLMKTVMSDKKLRAYADALSIASREEAGYVKPDVKNWLTQSIATDFRRLVTDGHRKNVLADFIANVEEIFTPEFLNKVESVYGTKFRMALFNDSGSGQPGAIQRMMSGRTGRGQGSKVTNWINGAIAPIMFLNQRSAVLQLLSAGNFINWTDNNPLMVAKAIGNPKQLVKDMLMIINSDKLVQRRSGLRFSIEEAELANIGGAESVWKIFQKRAIKLGFKPTQYADSLAIALGGAPFYRNRVNTYLTQGMSKAEAEAAAWKDFGRISDEAQQSSDQMLISQEQAGEVGRLILAFANTPAQYSRIMKKAALDIKNGRGDLKTNLSKIAYYGFLQNLIFSALQGALFTVGELFSDEENEDVKRNRMLRKQIYDEAYANAIAPRKNSTKPKNAKIIAEGIAEEAAMKFDRKIAKLENEKKDRTVNSMLDSILRGLGVRGSAIAATKNALLEMLAQKDNRAAMNEAKNSTNKEVAVLYEKVLDGSITLEEAKEGEKQLRQLLLEIDPGTPLGNTTRVLLAALSVSPPLGAKLRDVNSMITNERFSADVIDKKGWAYDSPRWRTIGLGLKVATNLPADYIPKKIEIIKQITQGDGTTSQKAWMGMGWSPYNMGLQDNEFEQIKEEAKLKRKEATADRAAVKRDLKKLKIDAANSKLSPRERKRLAAEAKRDRSAAGKKAAATRKANKAKKNRNRYEQAMERARLRRAKQ